MCVCRPRMFVKVAILLEIRVPKTSCMITNDMMSSITRSIAVHREIVALAFGVQLTHKYACRKVRDYILLLAQVVISTSEGCIA
jgi:hypothetical protein